VIILVFEVDIGPFEVRTWA